MSRRIAASRGASSARPRRRLPARRQPRTMDTNAPGSRLRPSQPAEEPRLRRGHGPDAGAGDRRQHRDLQRRQRRASSSRCRIRTPERLVFITSQFPGLGFDQFWVSAPEFVEFRERNRSFQDVGAYRAGAVNLGTPDQPRRVNSARRHLRADAGARRRAAARPPVHARGHAAGRGGRRGAVERGLAQRVRRRRVGRRTRRCRSTARRRASSASCRRATTSTTRRCRSGCR